MTISRAAVGVWLAAGLTFLPAQGRVDSQGPTEPREKETEAVRVLVDRIVARENELAQTLKKYSPRMETYLQSYESDSETGDEPTNDYYFFGRLNFGTMQTTSFISEPGSGAFPPIFAGTLRRAFSYQHEMDSFVQAAMVDDLGFNRKRYGFKFLRTEFLSEVRCLVFELLPAGRAERGQFKGWIWVEDRDYTIVRFKGVRLEPQRFHVYYHFDSWRQELQPKLWLPVYIYAEESDLRIRMMLSPKSTKIRFRSQTRFWGYQLSQSRREEELTRILIDAPIPVRDVSDAHTDPSPLASRRRWEREAESNVLERLEKAGLISPPSEVDKVLEIVVNNLILTNRLDNLPPIRCRVMLSLPFESFTVVHTILLSRGLIDVLPDEATLAAMLAHELGHIVLGHKTDIMFAFSDRVMLSDEKLFQAFDFGRTAREETDADAEALELLKKSPYKDNLGNVGLFIRAMAEKGPRLKKLFGSHLGNRLADGTHLLRLADTMQGAPQLQRKRLDQIAALPLGSRVKVDAWEGKVELTKSKPVAPSSVQEKMPFMVTPLFLNVTRKQSAEALLSKEDKATTEYGHTQN